MLDQSFSKTSSFHKNRYCWFRKSLLDIFMENNQRCFFWLFLNKKWSSRLIEQVEENNNGDSIESNTVPERIIKTLLILYEY